VRNFQYGAGHSEPVVEDDADDEALVRQLAAGRQAALGPLYGRYAPLIFSLAARTLDRETAEEIVQDVFLVVWRKAATFDPNRGEFRPWILRIAQHSVANELRRRRRRPQLVPDPDDVQLTSLPDAAPGPPEAAWREYRRSAVRSAVDALPPPQRRALSLAFFDELTHEQVAALLVAPLGTTKTRIRAGLRTLRGRLVPLLAALALAGIAGTLGVRYQAERAAVERPDRALRLVTASDLQPIRMTAAPGVPPEAHGTYRARPGVELVIVTLSYLPAAPAGRTYQIWALFDGAWTSVGRAEQDAGGVGARLLLIAEGPELARPPEAVQVTLEPAGGSATPTGPPVIAWTGR